MKPRNSSAKSLSTTLVLALLFAVPAFSSTTGDYNGDGVNDALDLFQSSLYWQEGVGSKQLLDAAGDWHTDAPTPTPTLVTTPSPTPTTPTPTPTSAATATPTRTPGSGGPQVLLTACRRNGVVGDSILITVHLLDAQGRIANPGVPGGYESTTVSLSVTGGASFYGNSTRDETILEPSGGYVQVQGNYAGSATVTATADGFAAAAPLALDFAEGGKIAGNVEVFDATMSAYRPATYMDLSIDILKAGTKEPAGYAMLDYSTPGIYESNSIPEGTYDIVFRSDYYGAQFETYCIPGVVVQTGQTTSNVDAQIDLRAPGNRLFGTISASDGTLLSDYSVSAIPLNDSDCARGVLQSWDYSETPMAAVPYELPGVADGQYGVTVDCYVDEDAYATIEPIELSFSGADVEKDITVYPFMYLAAVQPGDYARVPADFTIEWAAPAKGSNWVYSLEVYDGCGATIWEQSNITGTSVQYEGPALDPTQIYSWNLTGVADDASGWLEPWVGVSSNFLSE